MTDGEAFLIAQAIRGESSAFGALYDEYQPKIYRFILFKVSRSEEAEDLTHQVFLRAWLNIATYKSRGFPFSSWLYRIARNQVVDYYRTKKISVDLESAEAKETTEAAGIAESAETRLQMEKVLLAIRTLKSDYQDVLILRFIEDASLKETAQAMGKSEGAVKLLQHRALKELKEKLEVI